MEIRKDGFTAFVDALTSNTYVMVIMTDPTIGKWGWIYFYGWIVYGGNSLRYCICYVIDRISRYSDEYCSSTATL